MIPLRHNLYFATRSYLIFILLVSGGMSLVAQVPEYSRGNVQIGSGGCGVYFGEPVEVLKKEGNTPGPSLPKSFKWWQI